MFLFLVGVFVCWVELVGGCVCVLCVHILPKFHYPGNMRINDVLLLSSDLVLDAVSSDSSI